MNLMFINSRLLLSSKWLQYENCLQGCFLSAHSHFVHHSEDGEILVKGWVRSILPTEKGNKGVLLISDGFSQNLIKVILHQDVSFEDVSVHSSVVIRGRKVNSHDQSENFVLVNATYLKLKGKGNKFYKTKASERDSHSFIPPFFRSRFPYFCSRYHMRSKLKSILHQYCNGNGYCEVDPPILTRYLRDTEHESMHIEATSPRIGESGVDISFGHPVYLSTSPQIHLECIASGLSKVYSLGPTLRAGFTSGKNLFEFWALNCEEVYNEEQQLSFDSLLNNVEALMKYLIGTFLSNYKDKLMTEEGVKMLEDCFESTWGRFTYDEVLSIAKSHESEIKYSIWNGIKLGRNIEKALTESCSGRPYFVTDFPTSLKPFNAAGKQNDKCFAFDLIFPHSGQLVSGGLREHDYDRLAQNLDHCDAREYFKWFLDTHKWGSAPTRGFSLGIDRLLHFLLKDSDIKNVVSFPRSKGFCSA